MCHLKSIDGDLFFSIVHTPSGANDTSRDIFHQNLSYTVISLSNYSFRISMNQYVKVSRIWYGNVITTLKVYYFYDSIWYYTIAINVFDLHTLVVTANEYVKSIGIFSVSM